MRLLSVEIQNFFSFGPVQRVQLDNQGLVAVFGVNKDAKSADSNGAAKSALVESIVWCLYGETIRGYKGDEIINRKVGADCYVILTIQDSNITYKIKRTRGTTKAKKKNDVILTVEGSAATAGTNSDTQEQIETIIGMDFSTFNQSVILSYQNQSFSGMTDSVQKSILENILQIDTLHKARDIAKVRLSEATIQYNLIESERQHVNQMYAATFDKYNKLADSHKNYQLITKEKESSLTQKKAVIQQQLDITVQGADLSALLDQERASSEQIIKLSEDDHSLNKELLRITNTINVEKSKFEQALAVLGSQRAAIVNGSKSISSLAGAVCPKCSQMVSPAYSEDALVAHDNSLSALDQNAQNIMAGLRRLMSMESESIENINKKINDVRMQLKLQQTDQRELFDKIKKREAELGLVSSLKEQIRRLDEEITANRQTINPYEALIDEAKSELDTYHRRYKNLIYRHKNAEFKIKHLEFWHAGFGNQGLKSYIIDSVVPFLNQRVQRYADIMSGGDLHIEFSTQRQIKTGDWREEFQVRVINENGADVYRGNSSGEKRRADIAVSWALSDLAATRANKPICFRALDEIFSSLDEVGEDSVMKLLHAVVPEYETIFVISHSDHLRTQFPKHLTVTKENGFSTVR